ncbi:MAG: hypothetical protein VYA69_10335 [Gemmatimonadota bacterium]|nr:hypothetical protein [Gemmatimonadota bacterium]
MDKASGAQMDPLKADTCRIKNPGVGRFARKLFVADDQVLITGTGWVPPPGRGIVPEPVAPCQA